MAVVRLSTLGTFLRFAIQPAKGAWNLIGAGAIGATGAGLWLYHHALVGGLLILVAVVLLLCVAGYRLQQEIDQARIPYVAFDRFLYERQPSYLLQTFHKVVGGVMTGETEKRVGPAPKVILTKIRNDPPFRREEAEVKDAETQLEFFSLPSWGLELECDARWYDNEMPGLETPIDLAKRRRLPANGSWHDIEIVVNHGASGCYAASVDLYLTVDLQLPRLLLAGDNYAVALSIRGQNLPTNVTNWYTLKKVEGGKLEVKLAPQDFDTSEARRE